MRHPWILSCPACSSGNYQTTTSRPKLHTIHPIIYINIYPSSWAIGPHLVPNDIICLWSWRSPYKSSCPPIDSIMWIQSQKPRLYCNVKPSNRICSHPSKPSSVYNSIGEYVYPTTTSMPSWVHWWWLNHLESYESYPRTFHYRGALWLDSLLPSWLCHHSSPQWKLSYLGMDKKGDT